MDSSPAGYSGTPLPDVTLVDEAAAGAGLDLVVFFTTSAEELRGAWDRLASSIAPVGMLWVAWPKKASKVPTDVTEDVVRAVALERGMVDVKVCAIDAVWSGLKLVYRLKDRPARK
ncbi:MAG TPA: hypothetical protein VFQ39_19415 [Longimicrobium sp.]|nr:hypothetical protein [Longimicrobium sp.]